MKEQFLPQVKSAGIVSGITQEETAKYGGFPTITIKKYENDCTEMPINLAYKMSRLYNVSLDDLYIGKVE
ncbi:helix-turn-helix transcriptional regulator [Desulfosporosinus sp. SYSU MS00001]|uniref:helix-turn-helix transcriptional regulator n=1 Tax=Desulfosporosinus sp. SYSU MS00001 TaxID=3416284 RepID=UPI003CEA6ACC